MQLCNDFAYDANAIAAMGETHGDNSAPGAPNAEQTRFFFAMSLLNRNHPERIDKKRSALP
ncbi:MAG: hypothetical protein ABIU29_00775 [Chthoniobacterales bacterium]